MLSALLPDAYSTEHWPSPEVPSTDPWEKKYLGAKTDAERLEVIGEKEASGPEFLAPLLRRALKSDSIMLQTQAIESAHILEGGDAIDILSGATSHSSEEIAILAAEAVRGLPPETRLTIYQNLLGSPHESVREITVIDLSRESSKPAIDLLIGGLQDPAQSVSSSTRNFLQRLFYQNFDSASAARQWWVENQHNYTDTLQSTTAP